MGEVGTPQSDECSTCRESCRMDRDSGTLSQIEQWTGVFKHQKNQGMMRMRGYLCSCLRVEILIGELIAIARDMCDLHKTGGASILRGVRPHGESCDVCLAGQAGDTGIKGCESAWDRDRGARGEAWPRSIQGTHEWNRQRLTSRENMA